MPDFIPPVCVRVCACVRTCVCVRERQWRNNGKCGLKEIINYIIVCDYPDLEDVFVFLPFICLFSERNKSNDSHLIPLYFTEK